MIEQLFGSKTRVKLLKLFYENPNRSFYVREITRKIDEQINSVRRELANLLSIGIITSDNTNNKLYYEVNQKFEQYDAMSTMFGGKAAKSKAKKAATSSAKAKVSDEVPEVVEIIETVTTVQDPFAQELLKAGNISLAVYTGQFTRDETSGVDIVIVGDINASQLEHLVADLEKSEKKELRYTVFSPDEFTYRRQVNDRFYVNFIAAKKVVLLDKDNIVG